MVGRADHVDHIVARVEQLGFVCIRLDGPAPVATAVTQATLACLYVPPFVGKSANEAIAAVRRRGIALPTLVLMHSRLSAAQRTVLLESGCDAQLAWPGEEDVLVNTLVRHFFTGLNAADLVVEERVRTRIQGTLRSDDVALEVQLVGTTVHVRGSVDDAWQVETVRRVAVDVPGVEAIDLSEFERSPAVPSDNTSLPIE